MLLRGHSGAAGLKSQDVVVPQAVAPFGTVDFLMAVSEGCAGNEESFQMLKLNCWHANGNTDYSLLISDEVVTTITSLLRRAVTSNCLVLLHSNPWDAC